VTFFDDVVHLKIADEIELPDLRT